MHRVRTQPRRIVGIRISASDRHHPLRKQLTQFMLNFFRLPSVLQSLGESRGQMQTLIGSSQQNRSAIGTALSLIELRHYGTLRNSREENTLCRVMLAQAKASFWSQTRLRQRLCTMKRLFVSLRTCIIQASASMNARSVS